MIEKKTQGKRMKKREDKITITQSKIKNTRIIELLKKWEILRDESIKMDWSIERERKEYYRAAEKMDIIASQIGWEILFAYFDKKIRREKK